MAGKGTLQSVLDKFRKQEDMNAAVNRKAAEAWARVSAGGRGAAVGDVGIACRRRPTPPPLRFRQKKAMKKAKDEAKRKAAEDAARRVAAAKGDAGGDGPSGAGASAAPPAARGGLTVAPGQSTKDALRSAILPTAVPVAKQVKDALAALSGAGRAGLSASQVSAATGHDASRSTPLGRALADNVKVSVGADGRMRYRAVHDAVDAAGLVAAVAAAAPGGLPADELRDAYPAAAADVASLVASSALWALPRPADAGGVILFHPGDVPPPSPELASLWAAHPAPTDPDALEAALRRAGIKPAARRGPRRPPPPGPRRARRAAGPRVVTNAHMPELFAVGGPTSIDGPTD